MKPHDHKTPAQLRAQFKKLSDDMEKRANAALRDVKGVLAHVGPINKEIKAEAEHALKEIKRLAPEEIEA